MVVELKLLIASVVLGLVHLIASSHLISWQRGYRWTAGSREGDVPPLRGLANRVDQATTNFLETFNHSSSFAGCAGGVEKPERRAKHFLLSLLAGLR
jgi:uncharacterized MAPEG superfamily protein